MLAFCEKIVYNRFMDKKVRQPQQERSNEKKNKIIAASYEVFSEIGYHAASTPEIAKRAGVSTGIVYSYFKDKRDILLYVFDIYIGKIAKPFMEKFEQLTAPVDAKVVVPEIVDLTISVHKENAHLHNTLHALASGDDEVKERFMTLEKHITTKIPSRLRELGLDIPFMEEKVHIAMNSVQSFAHEFVYDRHDYLNYGEMRKSVEKSVIALFAEEE